MLTLGMKYVFRDFWGGYNYSSKGTYEEVIAHLVYVVLTIYVVGWIESVREEGKDPTVSNIVHDLTKCRDVALDYLRVMGTERVNCELRQGVNNIEILTRYMNLPELYREDRYAFCLSGDVLWVGYSLRQWKRSFFEFWGTSILDCIFSLLLFHPRDKVGRKNCKRLALRAMEVGLYGSYDLRTPPYSVDDRLYRLRDDAVWMPVSRIDIEWQ